MKRLGKGWTLRRGLLAAETPEKDRRSTAIHEAAHAVVAHVCGEQVKHVHLAPMRKRPSSHRSGWCKTRYRKRHGRIDPVVLGVVCLAGHEAEVRFCGRPMTLLPKGDLDIVKGLGCSWGSVNALGEIARRLVRWYAPQIRRVARALLDRGDLSRRQFLRAYRS